MAKTFDQKVIEHLSEMDIQDVIAVLKASGHKPEDLFDAFVENDDEMGSDFDNYFIKDKELSEVIDVLVEDRNYLEDIVDACLDKAAEPKTNDMKDIAEKCGFMFKNHGGYLVVNCPTQKQMGLLEEFCESNDLQIIE